MILVVDDDRSVCCFVTDCLGRFGPGRKCVAVPGIAAAQACLSKRHFDLIILDWTLCDGKAIDLLRWMRARCDATPVVALSATADYGDACLMQDFVVRMLKKPVMPSDLRDAVEKAVQSCHVKRDSIDAYLDAHMGEAVLVRDLARDLAVSPSQLWRQIKPQRGMAPKKYILWRKMQRAAELLAEGDLPLKAVAEELGLCGPDHLSHAFKKIMGVAPGEYRMQARGSSAAPGRP